MTILCPRCNSPNTSANGLTTKIGASIGILGGAIYGYRVGAVFGPIGMFTGTIAGLIGGAIAGCEIGYTLGKKIDEHVINLHKCGNCNSTFSI